MKFYSLTLPKNSYNELVYPINYQKEIGDYVVDYLYYNEGLTSKLMISIFDTNANNIIRENVVELTETEAAALSEVNEIRTEIITDEAKIKRIELKISLKQALTSNELKALDPTDLTPGFSMKQIFSDRIIKFKNIEKNI